MRLPATAAGAIALGVAATMAGAVAAASVLALPLALGIVVSAVGLATAASVAGCARLRRCRPLVVASLLVVAAGVGVLRGAGAAADARGGLAAHAGEGALVYEGTVRDSPAQRHSERLVIVDVERISTGAGVTAAHGGLLAAVTGVTDELLPGDRVRVEASDLRRPTERPGPESVATLDREGVAVIAASPRITVTGHGGLTPRRLLAQARQRLSAAVHTALAEPAATLVDEIALGIRGTIPADVSAPLQDAGLIHLVATSGLKVAIVIGLLARLLGPAPPRARTLLTLAGVAAYVALAGGGPAALRAALMAGCGLLLSGTGRRADPLPLLAVVAAGLLIVDPGLCRDVGFAFSFLGTLGILLLAGPIAKRVPGPRLFVEPFAVTAAAQLATTPVMAATFGVVSIAGPVANAVVVPAVPLLVLLGWVGAAAGCLAPSLGWLPLQLTGVMTGALLAVARWVASIPGAAVHVSGWPLSWTLAELALSAAAAAVAVVLRRGTPPTRSQAAPMPSMPPRPAVLVAVVGAALLTGGAVVVAGARADGRLHVTVLAVGAGTAVLVRTADGGTALVDAGSDPSRIDRAVGDALPPGARTIDLLVLTGGDRTSVAGLPGLSGHWAVARAVIPTTGISTVARTAIDALRAAGTEVIVDGGGSWSWGGASWRCVDAAVDSAGAAPACALQVADASGSALVLGGLAPADQEALAGTAGDSLGCDLLVAPPAGGIATALLDAVRPRQLAIPGDRPPRIRPFAPGAVVRSVGAGGALGYAGGPTGLQPG